MSLHPIQSSPMLFICFCFVCFFFLLGSNIKNKTISAFASDDSSWQAEAEIDMELFHQVGATAPNNTICNGACLFRLFYFSYFNQNHLVVKVPPYHDLTVTSPVSVRISVLTNAGRTHELQPFTYTPQPGLSRVY